MSVCLPVCHYFKRHHKPIVFSFVAWPVCPFTSYSTRQGIWQQGTKGVSKVGATLRSDRLRCLLALDMDCDYSVACVCSLQGASREVAYVAPLHLLATKGPFCLIVKLYYGRRCVSYLPTTARCVLYDNRSSSAFLKSCLSDVASACTDTPPWTRTTASVGVYACVNSCKLRFKGQAATEIRYTYLNRLV